MLFLIGDWNAKVGNIEEKGVTGRFGLGEQNVAGERLVEFCFENQLFIANAIFFNANADCIHGHHQMAKTEIRLITSWAKKDGKVRFRQSRLFLELAVEQITSCFTPLSK